MLLGPDTSMRMKPALELACVFGQVACVTALTPE